MAFNTFDLLVILGATAGGKTGLAVAAARRFQGEVISADSRQVYRGMDLGTGKDLHEYAEIPYHLIDIVDAGAEYNLFRFQQDAFSAITGVKERGKLPILCGGSALYLDAVIRGYRLVEVHENPALRTELFGLSDEQLRIRLLELKPEQHNRTDLDQRERLIRAIEIAIGEREAEDKLAPLPEIRPLVCGLRWPRPELHRRIARRLDERLDMGMIDEVAKLHAAGVPWERLDFYGLEYRFIARFLQGQLGREEMVTQLRSAIANFAKRQETFFRNIEKKGVPIHWLDGESDPFAQLCSIVDQQSPCPQ